MDISRRKAQKVITSVLGEDFFARKSTKTAPTSRYEIARWTKSGKLEKVAAGDTWFTALINAAEKLQRKDVLTSAQEVRRVIMGENP